MQQCGGIDDKEIYFFTNFNKKKSCVIRKVGYNGATWRGENKGQQVFSSINVLIGSIKRFHYETPKDNDCSWIVREYTIDHTSISKEFMHNYYVFCILRISRKNIKKFKKM